MTTAKNKLAEFQQLVVCNQFDFICVSETWLNDKVVDGEILPSTFTMHRRDRVSDEHERGGGVLLACRSDIHSIRRKDLESDDYEILVCEIRPDGGEKFAMIVCYNPPDGTDRMGFVFALRNVLELCDQNFNHLCVLGDFNFPNIDWDTVSCNSDNAETREFCDVVNEFSLFQLVHCPTHKHGNTLDLILTNQPERFHETETWPGMFDSDHFPVVSNFKLRMPKRNGVPRTVFDYRNGDYHGLKAYLGDTLGPNSEFFQTHSHFSDDLDSMWSDWLDVFECGCKRFIPTRTIRDHGCPRWIDKDVKHLSNRVNTARKNAKNRNTAPSWAKYRRLRNQLRNMTRAKYNSYVNSLGRDIHSNPKRFWNFYHAKTKSNSIPETVNNGNDHFSDAKEKADAFNRCFFSNFSNREYSELPNVTTYENYALESVLFSPNDVKNVLKSLDRTKACGSDRVSPRILQMCASELCTSLALIFNASMQLGSLPGSWKIANVCPVFKKGDRHLISNYRPVSLLSCVSKVMERCIYNHIYPILRPLICSEQHGFSSKRSTVTQLVQVQHRIGEVIDRSGQVDVIYLDLARAFDSVPHSLLLHKIKSFGICGRLLNWFTAYLTGRSQRVIINGSESALLDVTSGVPQGSILGPLLFNLYINDLSSVVSLETFMGLFADDSKIYREIKEIYDAIQLQNDLESVHAWCKKWGMNFSPGKCVFMRITRKRRPVKFTYNIDGTILSQVDHFKDLGVTFQSDLNWNRHVDASVTSASRVWGMVRRVTGCSANLDLQRMLYQCLVRSRLEYGSVVWDTHLHRNLTSIENVQRRVSRHVVGPENSYADRLVDMNLLPLSFRREVTDLLFMHQCFYGSLDFDTASFINGFTRREDDLLLRQPRFFTETFAGSFFIRGVKLWNNLPLCIRKLENRQSFKNELNAFYANRVSFVNCFIPCTLVSFCRCHNCRPA